MKIVDDSAYPYPPSDFIISDLEYDDRINIRVYGYGNGEVKYCTYFSINKSDEYSDISFLLNKEETEALIIALQVSLKIHDGGA